jgi:hypothetical protein
VAGLLRHGRRCSAEPDQGAGARHRARRCHRAGASAATLLAALACALAALAAPALAVETQHAFERTISPAGSKCAFTEPGAVALSASGEAYVIDRATNRLEHFTAWAMATREEECVASKKIGVAETSEATNEGLAIDDSGTSPSNGDVYVWAPEEKAIDKFALEGKTLKLVRKTHKYKNLEGETVEFESELYGMAVDASGDLWLYTSEGVILEFSGNEPNTLIAQYETNTGICQPRPGFAVAPHGEYVYAARERENASEQCDAEAPVLVRMLPEGTPVDAGGQEVAQNRAQIDWEANSGGAVDPATGETYFDNGSSISAFTADEAFTQRFGDSSPGALANASGVGLDPVSGQVAAANPGEAGTIELYQAVLPANEAPEPRTAHALPDGRVWEQVSPQNKLGAQIYPISRDFGIVQASTSGNAITYTAAAPLVANTPETQSPGPNQVMSRLTATGWTTESIGAPREAKPGEEEHPTGVPIETGNEYRIFSEDLTTAFLQPNGYAAHRFEPKLAPEATETTLYREDLSRPRSECETLPSTCYTALVYPHEQEGVPIDVGPFGGKLWYYSTTPDGRYSVFRSEVKLLPSATSADGLYEWSAEGGLHYVSALPEGEAEPFGGGSGEPSLGAPGEREGGAMRNAISSNGQMLVWSLAPSGEASGALYLTDVADGRTIRLDSPQGIAPPPEPVNTARFQTASSDGRHIFFTDPWPLTPDATTRGIETTEAVQEEGLGDLYECDVHESGGNLSCELHDLTADTHGEWAGVQGVLGANAQGTIVYYVANGSLTNQAGRGDCATDDPTTNGQALEEAEGKIPATYCGLYVDRLSGGTWTPERIATLSGQDRWDWYTDVTYALGKMTSGVSSDGRYAAFMSDRSLTGYDNIDVNESGGPHADEEVYRYDAQEKRLVCVSCNPSNARPKGMLDPRWGHFAEGYAPFIDYPLIWEGRWLAANIPGWTVSDRNTSVHQSRYLSNGLGSDGRMFFNSSDKLVPADTNSFNDVYEYEPDGVGSCASATGCVSLLSSGSSPAEAAFLDASENGDNVFLITNAQLTSSDTDDVSDVYDVHACSETSPCAASPPEAARQCEHEAECRSGPPATLPAPAPVPPSALPGPGNVPVTRVIRPPGRTRQQLLQAALRACRKAHRRKHPRQVCERAARKRYGTAKKAGHHGRTSHRRGRRR